MEDESHQNILLENGSCLSCIVQHVSRYISFKGEKHSPSKTAKSGDCFFFFFFKDC